MILVVDNYDSFTYNLVQALGSLGAELEVRRNDAVTVDEVETLGVRGIVISPGPGRPAAAGVCLDLIRAWGPRLPLLGVCLGHQALAEAHGGRIVPANEIVHGKSAEVDHQGDGLFAGLAQPMIAMRYHSLTVDEASLPEVLVVNARSGDNVMGVRHRQLPLHGVQFHPESIATPEGTLLLQNFLDIVAAAEASTS